MTGGGTPRHAYTVRTHPLAMGISSNRYVPGRRIALLTRSVTAFFLAHILAFAVLLGGAPPARADGTANVKYVLVLYTDDRLLPANVVIDGRFRQAFAHPPGRAYRVEYFSEFLD